MRSHYIPKSYLSRWIADGDERVWVAHRDLSGRVIVKLRHPSSFGYVRDLYKFDVRSTYGFAKDPDALERYFANNVESPASLVIERMLGGHRLFSYERVIFLRFIRAFTLRHVETIRELLADGESVVRHTIEAMKAGRLDSEAADRLSSTLDAMADDRAFGRNTLLGQLPTLLEDPESDEIWSTFQICLLTADVPSLITSSHPLLLNGKRRITEYRSGESIALFEIALSPRHLCVIGRGLESADDSDFGLLLASYNDRMMQSRPSAIYSSFSPVCPHVLFMSQWLEERLPPTDMFRKIGSHSSDLME